MHFRESPALPSAPSLLPPPPVSADVGLHAELPGQGGGGRWLRVRLPQRAEEAAVKLPPEAGGQRQVVPVSGVVLQAGGAGQALLGQPVSDGGVRGVLGGGQGEN